VKRNPAPRRRREDHAKCHSAKGNPPRAPLGRVMVPTQPGVSLRCTPGYLPWPLRGVEKGLFGHQPCQPRKVADSSSGGSGRLLARGQGDFLGAL
jgi:hypothetical protein